MQAIIAFDPYDKARLIPLSSNRDYSQLIQRTLADLRQKYGNKVWCVNKDKPEQLRSLNLSENYAGAETHAEQTLGPVWRVLTPEEAKEAEQAQAKERSAIEDKRQEQAQAKINQVIATSIAANIKMQEARKQRTS